MTLTRDMIRRIVREEVFRALEADRRRGATAPPGGGATPQAAFPATARRRPTHALLCTGRAGLSDAFARLAARAVASGRLACWSADDAFAASDCGRDLARRLDLPARRLPPHHAPAAIPWGARALDGVRTLLVLPASLTTLAGLVTGTHDGGGGVLYQALGRGWRVLLAGQPHRAEGLPALKPGDALAAQERDLVAAAGRLGCEVLSAAALEDVVARLEAAEPDGRAALAGRGRIAWWTVADVEAAARRGESVLLLDAAARLTPSGADRAAELGLRIVHPE